MLNSKINVMSSEFVLVSSAMNKNPSYYKNGTGYAPTQLSYTTPINNTYKSPVQTSGPTSYWSDPNHITISPTKYAPAPQYYVPLPSTLPFNPMPPNYANNDFNVGSLIDDIDRVLNQPQSMNRPQMMNTTSNTFDRASSFTPNFKAYPSLVKDTYVSPNRVHFEDRGHYHSPARQHHSPSNHQNLPPMHQHPPFMHQNPPPMHQHPPLMHQHPPPMNQNPPPMHQHPPPMHLHPLPMNQNPPPMNQHLPPPLMHQHSPPPPMRQHSPPMHRHSQIQEEGFLPRREYEPQIQKERFLPQREYDSPPREYHQPPITEYHHSPIRQVHHSPSPPSFHHSPHRDTQAPQSLNNYNPSSKYNERNVNYDRPPLPRPSSLSRHDPIMHMNQKYTRQPHGMNNDFINPTTTNPRHTSPFRTNANNSPHMHRPQSVPRFGTEYEIQDAVQTLFR
jgi:hypothetical protein